MREITVPFLHIKNGVWNWKPSAAARRLGFKNVALGTDEVAAAAEALRLWKRYQAVRDGRVYAGSFNHLRDVYCGAERIEPSREWSKLSAESKRDYGRYLDVICGKWGDFQVGDLDPELVAALHASYKDRPYAGNQCIKVLSTLFTIAMNRPTTFPAVKGMANPCENISLYGTKEGVQSRERVWADDEVAAFDAAADLELRMARLLYSYTGQRTADVLAMRDTDYRVDPNGDRWLHVAQQKTGKRVWVYCHADLAPAIEGHVARHRAAREQVGAPLIQNTRGETFNRRVFVARWDRAAVKAGIVALAAEKGARRDRSNPTRHDLRRTAVTRLAEAGCTPDEISSITGLSIAMINKQVYNVRSRAHSKAGVKKLEDYRK